MQVLEGITAAQEALDLLLPAGDFSGALDVLWDLKTAGTPAYVTGLHAFQMLPQQLAACEEVTDLAPSSELDIDSHSCTVLIEHAQVIDTEDTASSCAESECHDGRGVPPGHTVHRAGRSHGCCALKPSASSTVSPLCLALRKCFAVRR